MGPEIARMKRRTFLGGVAGTVFLSILRTDFGATWKPVRAAVQTATHPNILLITADDLGYDSLGVTGSRVPGVSPNLDKLASEGVRFEFAHVSVSVCQPSRSALMTGRYAHRNGATGFNPIRDDVPTLPETLGQAGYVNGILGKVEHLTPARKFPWDTAVGNEDLAQGRKPEKYYECTKRFIEKAKGKPFFLMANSCDPHRPFPGSDAERKQEASGGPWPKADRYYTPGEVTVPGFLPDLADVRKEIAQYYTSVRRCDETVGQVLRALEESGRAEDTLVMFLSDNGMSFPFAKANCYRSSTRTPWMARWPGRIVPGRVDTAHGISGIDFMPTVIEAARLAGPVGMDGRSFLPILEGQPQGGRETVCTAFYKTSSGDAYPMRSIQTRRFAYIWNPWSDGKTIFKNEAQSGLAMRAMIEAAKTDPRIAERVHLFLYRVSQEFYDYENDPHALENRIGDLQFRSEIDGLRNAMYGVMKSSEDPLAEAFRKAVLDASAAGPRLSGGSDAASGKESSP